MRYRFSLALFASMLMIGWQTPTSRADDMTQLEKIMEQVAQTLDQADLPAATKESLLHDLRQSLAKTLNDDAAEPQPTADEQTQTPAPDSEDATDADEASPDRRNRVWQQPRVTLGRRAETLRAEAERRARRAMQGAAAQPARFAIGVMLEPSDEPSDEPDAEGKLVITEVFPDSPAAEAKLQSGDVIRKFDGEELTDASEITRRVDQAGRENKSLTLEIGREDEVLTVEVTPAPRPDSLAFDFARPDWAFPAAPGMPGFGGDRDPQWRFPTPLQGGDSDRIAEIIDRIERQEQVVERLQQAVEELRNQNAAESETEEADSSEDD